MADRNFKIVDSFLFSETYEKELLLLKFILEDDGIDEWILLENAYSFQGNYTGLHAKKMIESDSRFDRYKHKLTIISKEEKTKEIPKHQFMDDLSFQVEYWQRDLANDYFLQNYDNSDWIMVSDVDEMIDFTDGRRKKELYERMDAAKNGLLVVPTKRYWNDFDNEYKVIIGSAMCTKAYLVKNNKMLHHVRAENRRVMKKGWKNIVEFEYSSCYDPEHMLTKFYTSTHTGFTPEDLKQSLRCNHRPTRGILGIRPENNTKYFFETVELTEQNSPKYVRDNLSFYKLNVIDKDYKQNRRVDYPELFTAGYHVKSALKNGSQWFMQKKKLLKKIARKVLGRH